MGISHNDSANWQREASIPEDTFDDFVEMAKWQRNEITTAALLRLARKMSGLQATRTPRRKREPLLSARKFSSTGAARDRLRTETKLKEAQDHLFLLQSIVERLCSDETLQIERVDRHCMLRYTREVIALLENLDDE